MGVVTFLLAAVTPTPEGCHLVTPPPGTFGAGECNLDQQFRAVDTLMSLLTWFVFVPVIGFILLVGILAFVTARGPLPDALVRHLPREPASPRDRRLQGLGLTLVALGALAGAMSVQRELASPSHDSLLLAGMVVQFGLIVAGAAVNMTARQRVHRSGEVMSGWDEIGRLFRS